MMRTEKIKAKALRGALEACSPKTMRARRSGLHASEAVYKLSIYFLVAERDLQGFESRCAYSSRSLDPISLSASHSVDDP